MSQPLATAGPAVSQLAQVVLNYASKGYGEFVGQLTKAAGAVRQMTIAAGAFAGGWATAALSGTQEAAGLSAAFGALAKAIGDGLGPFVRLLTAGVVSLVQAFQGLDPATKLVIGGLLAASAAAAAFVAVLPTIVAIGGSLITVLGALVSPIGLITTGIAGLTAAFLANQADTKGWQGVVTDAVEMALDAWDMLSDGIGQVVDFVRPIILDVAAAVSQATTWVMESLGLQQGVWDKLRAGVAAAVTFIATMVKNHFEMVKADFTNLVRVGEWLYTNWTSMWQDLAKNTVTIIGNLIGEFDKFGAALKAWVKSGFMGDFKYDFSSFGKEMAKGLQRTTSEFPDFVRADIKNPLLEAARAWDDALAKSGKNRGLAEGLVGNGMEVINKVKKAFDNENAKGGLHLQVQAQFESLGSTFDRLQKALLDDPAQNTDKKQVDLLTDIGSTLKEMVTKGLKINVPPAVGN